MASFRTLLSIACLAVIGGGFILLNPTKARPHFVSEAGPLAGYHFPTEAALTGWDDTRLQRDENEEPLAFASRLTRVIGQSIYHCQDPVQDTIFAKISDRFLKLRKIGTLSPRFLPCGLCHQVASVLVMALIRGGVNASVYSLNGHITTIININGERYISDPDLDIKPFKANIFSENEIKNAASEAYRDLSQRLGVGMNNEWIAYIISTYASIQDNFEFKDTNQLQIIEKRQNIALEILTWLSRLGWALLALALIIAGYTAAEVFGSKSRRLRQMPDSRA